MTEGVATTTHLNPLMQSWLDDVSNLLAEVNEMGAELELKQHFVAPEVAAELNRIIEDLKNEVASKDNEIAGQKRTERILLNSVQALQQEVSETNDEVSRLRTALATANDNEREAVRLLNGKEAEYNAKFEEQARAFDERDKQRDIAVDEAKSVMRQLRLDLAKERVEGLKRAEALLRKEHALDIAKNHQIGKNKGIAIATAYIDAAKEEKADLERSSHLASNVVIQSAERIESGLVIHEASMVAEGGGNGGLPGTQKEIRMKEDEPEETEENNSRALLGFSRKLR